MQGDFRLGNWLIQPQRNVITRNGEAHRLEPKVMQVLVCLAESRGEVVSKQKLMQTVWPSTFVTEDALTRSISELRKIFRDCFKRPDVIETIPKRGYRLVAEVALHNGPVAQPERPVRSLVVLPLRWVAGSNTSRFCADEVTDAITSQLAKIPALQVVSQTTAMNYRDRVMPLKEIGRELGVDAVLEGSVVIIQNRVRVTVQLVDAMSDCHLWAESYDHSARNAMQAQDRIARDIARAIAARISGHVRTDNTPAAGRRGDRWERAAQR